MVGCLSITLKFSIPTGCCRSFQGNGGQLRDAHPAAHPFNLTPRRDVLSRRDLGPARNGPSSSQVQSGSISDSGQGCRVCLGLGGAGCQSRAVAWCAAPDFSARERKNELDRIYVISTRLSAFARRYFCAKNLPEQAKARFGAVVHGVFSSFGSLSLSLRMEALWC